MSIIGAGFGVHAGVRAVYRTFAGCHSLAVAADFAVSVVLYYGILADVIARTFRSSAARCRCEFSTNILLRGVRRRLFVAGSCLIALLTIEFTVSVVLQPM